MKVIGAGSPVRRDSGKPRSRCRKWELSVHVEDDSGVRSRRTRPFSGTYTQAIEELDAFVAELSDAFAEAEEVDDGMTMPQLAREWHERRVRSMELAKSSLANDDLKIRLVDMHMDVPVSSVTSDYVRDVYWRLSEGQTPSGRPYKPKSIEGFHKALVGMFGYATRAGYVEDNPMDDVRSPKVPKGRVACVPSPCVDYLLRSLDYSDGIQRALALIAACGLRLSESVSVRWRDIGDSVYVWESKTDAGRRAVPIPRPVAERLLEFRGANDFSVSGAVRGDSVRRWLKRHDAELFVPGATPHMLRHSYCTRLAEAGVHPRMMMELMGHSSIDVCMEVYTHVNSVSKTEAVMSAFGSLEM